MGAAADVEAAVRSVLPAGPVLIALSGGPDSAVVAWACLQVRGATAVRLVHVDHGLPGSPMMRAAAGLVADHLGLPVRVVAVDVGGAGSEETRARIARLAALDMTAADDEWIVTGHHRDDAAETVLGNLLRGAGATGLGGIAPRRHRLVRPLIDVPAATVRAAADELRLPYRNDPANEDLRHRRNILRHRLLPELEALSGTDVRAALHRTGRILSADDALLEAKVEAVPLRVDAGAALIPAPLLTTLPRPLAARVVRRAFRMARPPYPGTAAEVGTVLQVAAEGGRGQLLDGWHAIREGVYVAVAPSLELDPIEAADLEVPGVTRFGYGHRIAAAIEEAGPHPARIDQAWFDASLATAGLVVRCADPGERIDIGRGSKAVRDALAEADVPVRHRATWPVVAVRERIAWVPGARLAAWAHAPGGTATKLVLRWERTMA